MAKPLDGIAFPAYVRRLGFSRETQELLAHIRSSPPSRTPGAQRGNMPVWYPSTKMQCIIKAESAKVEFAFLLGAEHDDEVLEIWKGHLRRRPGAGFPAGNFIKIKSLVELSQQKIISSVDAAMVRVLKEPHSKIASGGVKLSC